MSKPDLSSWESARQTLDYHFEVGATVRVRNPISHSYNRRGAVEDRFPSRMTFNVPFVPFYRVALADGETWNFRESELEAVSE